MLNSFSVHSSYMYSTRHPDKPSHVKVRLRELRHRGVFQANFQEMKYISVFWQPRQARHRVRWELFGIFRFSSMPGSVPSGAVSQLLTSMKRRCLRSCWWMEGVILLAPHIIWEISTKAELFALEDEDQSA